MVYLRILLPLYLAGGDSCQTYDKSKKRYACLVMSCDWKRRKFSIVHKRWHSGSHAIAWAAISISVHRFFLRPPIRHGIAVPRFGVK